MSRNWAPAAAPNHHPAAPVLEAGQLEIGLIGLARAAFSGSLRRISTAC